MRWNEKWKCDHKIFFYYDSRSGIKRKWKLLRKCFKVSNPYVEHKHFFIFIWNSYRILFIIKHLHCHKFFSSTAFIKIISSFWLFPFDKVLRDFFCIVIFAEVSELMVIWPTFFIKRVTFDCFCINLGLLRINLNHLLNQKTYHPITLKESDKIPTIVKFFRSANNLQSPSKKKSFVPFEAFMTFRSFLLLFLYFSVKNFHENIWSQFFTDAQNTDIKNNLS